MYGSDQSASLEPSGLRQLLGAGENEISMGDGSKKIFGRRNYKLKKLRQHL